ncbi:hypothetical protein GCM10010405_25120 [Streptomyces macrosporus]|uniref:DNA polymerase III subunit delta n=1 Tax=Streptomyces macrosporus TaxID=44032 RepID=A0ABN3JXM6_9ACTN
MTVRGTARAAVHAAAGHRLGAAEPRQEGPADLRLTPPALAAWGAAALALGVPGRTAVVGAVVCCLAAAVCLLLARGRGGGYPAAALALVCAAAGGGVAAAHAADVHRGPLSEPARRHAHVTAEVTVTGDPRVVRPRVHGSEQLPGMVMLRAEAVRVTASDGTVTDTRSPVLLMVRRDGTGGQRTGAEARSPSSWLDLLPSTRLRVRARLLPPREEAGGRDVAAVLRVRGEGPPTVTGEPTAAQRTAGDLRAGLREAADGLPPDARALLPALVVGDTSRIPPDLDAAFRAADMLHLLAVSGANLAILLVLLVGPPGTASRAERGGVAPRLGMSLRTTAVTGALLTLAFVVVCRPEPSVLRAAACGLITIVAIATGRRRSLLPALAAAVLLLVLYDPWLARDFGFLLSVLATGSLLTLAPRWSASLRRRGVPGRLAEALAAAAAAQAVCAPVVAVLAAHVSLVAIPCNLLAEFLVAPATVLGFAALAAAPLAPPLAEALAWAAGWPTGAIAAIARAGASLPGAEIDWPGTWAGALLLAALTVVVVLAARRLPGHPWLCAACAVLLVLAVLRPAPLIRPFTGWPPPDWRLAVCDVGQGDALALAAGEGAAVVVDTGPEPEAVDRCLRALGVTAVPLLVLTHFHADHVAGLSGVLRGRAVGAIQTTPLGEPSGQAAAVRHTAARAGVPVVRAGPGERRRIGDLSWEVLWPRAPAPPGPPSPSGEDANDASVTLLVRAADLTVFLPGDLEPPAQQELLTARPDLPRVDVLKVAHHGSAYQDPALLERLDPRIALVSAGEENPYGHPAPRTLAALRAAGAVVLRTDVHGSLAVTSGGTVVGSAGRRGTARRLRPRARDAPGGAAAHAVGEPGAGPGSPGGRAARPSVSAPGPPARSPRARPAPSPAATGGRPVPGGRGGPGPPYAAPTAYSVSSQPSYSAARASSSARSYASAGPSRTTSHWASSASSSPASASRIGRGSSGRPSRSATSSATSSAASRSGSTRMCRTSLTGPFCGRAPTAHGGGGCRRLVGCWSAMATRTRKSPTDDPLAPVTLAVGQEDLLLDRAVRQVIDAAKAADADTDVRELASADLRPGTLAELTSPSLFAERKVVVVRDAQDLAADTVKDVKEYLKAPAEEITLVLVHAGGAKGKGLLDAARKAGAREVACPKMTKPADRQAFVRSEFRTAGRSATPEACQALVDALGSDLRELASACSQLMADVEGTIDEAVVARYYSGRAEASSFTIADRAVEGRLPEALEALRWSLATGVAPVLVTSALAQGVRGIGRLLSAPRGMRPGDLARELGMPPWKIDRVRQQMRGWSADGVAVALRAVAEADAAVKGGGDDPEYALEKAVMAVARAARSR